MKIKHISYEKSNQLVYNFHCSPNENYFANGMLVHNCYKSNTTKGSYMTFETFKKVFDKLPKTLTQIAFGADATLESNPDIWKIIEYSRNNDVIPNITVADINDMTAKRLAYYCGAVAVSRYENKDICYNSVKKLTDAGMTQVNIHYMIAEETYEQALETLNDIKEDPRLSKLNAIVFLSLKQKGRGKSFTPLSQEKFTELTQYALGNNIPIGFDSCSSLKFFKSLNSEQFKEYKKMIMPCESTLESSYINVDGEFFPCSFTEGTEDWTTGTDVVNCEDFIKDVWNNPRVNAFRDMLIDTKSNNKFNCRECPLFNI